MAVPPVHVPVELLASSKEILEGYVQSRISQVLSVLSRRLQYHAPNLPFEAISKSIGDCVQAVPPPSYASVPINQRLVQLVFRHDCMALGCLDPQCVMCQHNPSRRCSVNFDRKYLVNDVLKAKCGSNIRIELVDKITGEILEEDIPDLRLEMFILDGNLYDGKFSEGGKMIEEGSDPEQELEACALVLNKKKNTPLLVCGVGGANDSQGKVIIPMTDGGRVMLPELHVSDSSEAILSGRKPPFRLLVRALLPPSRSKFQIHHAVSEGFVVATRRTRNTGKVDIPSIDDPVSKLEHMGRETVRKLQDIHAAGQQVGLDIDIPENCVEKVGDFKKLALRVDQDAPLRQRLQHILKLSKEKWEEAREHSQRAVVGDSRLRAWYTDCRTMEMGLLFSCRLGCVDLERPVALIQSRRGDEGQHIQTTRISDLLPMQRELMHRMQPDAARTWWMPGHPGWAILPVETESFLQTGSLLSPAGSPTSAVRTMSEQQRANSALSGGFEASRDSQNKCLPTIMPFLNEGYAEAQPKFHDNSMSWTGSHQSAIGTMRLLPNQNIALPGNPFGLQFMPSPFHSVTMANTQRRRTSPSSSQHPKQQEQEQQQQQQQNISPLKHTVPNRARSTGGVIESLNLGAENQISCGSKRPLDATMITCQPGSQDRQRRDFMHAPSGSPTASSPNTGAVNHQPESKGTSDIKNERLNPFMFIQQQSQEESSAKQQDKVDGMYGQSTICVLRVSPSPGNQDGVQMAECTDDIMQRAKKSGSFLISPLSAVKESNKDEIPFGLPFEMVSGDLEGLLYDAHQMESTNSAVPLPYDFLKGVLSTLPEPMNH